MLQQQAAEECSPSLLNMFTPVTRQEPDVWAARYDEKRVAIISLKSSMSASTEQTLCLVIIISCAAPAPCVLKQASTGGVAFPVYLQREPGSNHAIPYHIVRTGSPIGLVGTVVPRDNIFSSVVPSPCLIFRVSTRVGRFFRNITNSKICLVGTYILSMWFVTSKIASEGYKSTLEASSRYLKIKRALSYPPVTPTDVSCVSLRPIP
jgi:hypothetical protein